MKTAPLAAVVITFRDSWGNSQATSETIFSVIGQRSLGNEIRWCPVTCLLSSPSDWNCSVVFGSSEVQLFVFHLNISKRRIMGCLDFSKLLPRLNSCSCLGQSSLHMVSVLFVCTLRPSAWLHKCFSSSSSFYFIALPPLLFSPLLLITVTSFPPSSLAEFFAFPLPLHSCHTQILTFWENVWAQEGSMCRKGGGGKKNAKISPVPYFSQEDLSVFYKRGAPTSTCAPVMDPSD